MYICSTRHKLWYNEPNRTGGKDHLFSAILPKHNTAQGNQTRIEQNRQNKHGARPFDLTDFQLQAPLRSINGWMKAGYM